MLALAAGLTVCIAPLLQGSWDLWSQTLLRLAFLGLGAAWLAGRLAMGTLPLPRRGLLLWAGLLATAAAVSAAFSPIHALAWPDACNGITALLLVCAGSLLGRVQRERVELALRLSAWAVFALAGYQHWYMGEGYPASSLVNPNVYAVWILLTLPLAWRQRDWALVAASLLALVWTHSLGAWMALSGALILLGFRRNPALFWVGVTAAFFCAVALYGKTQSPEFGNRAIWWGAALRMIADRPWLGAGPGAFAFLLPAYRADAPGLGSLYAHQSWLELAVGYGLPWTALFSAVVLAAVWSGRGPIRFAVLAAALHSLGDYALLVPANLWLFSFLTGALMGGDAPLLGVRARWKIPLIAATLMAAAVLSTAMLRLWQTERLVAQAREQFARGEARATLELLTEARRIGPNSPFPPLLLAQLAAGSAQPDAADRFQLEGARLNPYRASSWRDLAQLRARRGDAAGAQAALDEGARWVPWMK